MGEFRESLGTIFYDITPEGPDIGLPLPRILGIAWPKAMRNKTMANKTLTKIGNGMRNTFLNMDSKISGLK